ncbi:hypothetical protein [Kitasatospora sp. NPDC050543]|uniref:hypothetical protein n=1 Tax=Kitasatospora sp. NPDC050543 TaxID=3364054 RepID=UPI0037AE2077
MATALGFTVLSRSVDVNPMVRVGQVSGLAHLQLYAALLGLPPLAWLLYAAYRGSQGRFWLAQRLTCAAVAGLATGVVAGGVTVALHGTPWALGGQGSDPANLQAMAQDIIDGRGLPVLYPPGFPAVLAFWAEHVRGGQPGFALKDLQLVFSALVGPMSYLAWRLVLRPVWALMIAIPAALVFLDPIRPYSHVVMIVLLPLLAAFLGVLRTAPNRRLSAVLLLGASFGVAFGLMILWYVGWFVWAGPGALVLIACTVPWRRGGFALRRAGLFAGVAGLCTAVVGSPVLWPMLNSGTGTVDRYAYPGAFSDPAYVFGWLNDRPGAATIDNWPVPGELAGQTGFVLLLLLGVALGVGLGVRYLPVRATLAALVSAWLLRFWYASRMEHDQAVMLYPRTTWMIMYCLMILAVFGVMLTVRRGSGWLNVALASAEGVRAKLPVRGVRQAVAGAICAIALFATMGASWSANRYMPELDPTMNSLGIDSYHAHQLQRADGSCSPYAPEGKCTPGRVLHASPPGTGQEDPQLWCAAVPGPQWPTTCGRPAPWAK